MLEKYEFQQDTSTQPGMVIETSGELAVISSIFPLATLSCAG